MSAPALTPRPPETSRGGAGSARSAGTALRRRRTVAGWTFIMPNFLGFVLLTLGPVLALFYIAFTK